MAQGQTEIKSKKSSRGAQKRKQVKSKQNLTKGQKTFQVRKEYKAEFYKAQEKKSKEINKKMKPLPVLALSRVAENSSC